MQLGLSFYSDSNLTFSLRLNWYLYFKFGQLFSGHLYFKNKSVLNLYLNILNVFPFCSVQYLKYNQILNHKLNLNLKTRFGHGLYFKSDVQLNWNYISYGGFKLGPSFSQPLSGGTYYRSVSWFCNTDTHGTTMYKYTFILMVSSMATACSQKCFLRLQNSMPFLPCFHEVLKNEKEAWHAFQVNHRSCLHLMPSILVS